MTSVKILVSYKNLHKVLRSDAFVPIQTGRDIAPEIFENMIGDNTGENISKKNEEYCELTAQYWAWKNYQKLDNPSYIGFVHYRRLFNFQQEDIRFLEQYKMDSATVMEACQDADVIVHHKLPAYSPKLKANAKNLRDQWSVEYKPEDLEAAIAVIKEKYPQMVPFIEPELTAGEAYWYNIFVMKKDLFFEYSQWLFSILEACERTVTEPRRLGMLGERLINIFLAYKKSQQVTVKELPIFRPMPEQYQPSDPKLIPIVLASSDLYVPQVATVITSVIENCKQKQNLMFYIFSGGIRRRNRKKLVRYVEKLGSHLTIIPPSKQMISLFEGLPLPKHVPVLTFLRLLVPVAFPQYDKAIYLDSDILVRKDIADLYQIDLGESSLGMVEDVANTHHSRRLWGKESSAYYNGGVLLINNALLRQKNYLEDMLHSVHLNGERYLFCDQDIINDYFKGSIKPIDPQWNQHHEDHECAFMFRPSDPALYKEHCQDPAIVHYVGAEKVWYNNASRMFKKEYFTYWKKTPFYHWFRIDKYRKNDKKVFNINVGTKILFQRKITPDRTYLTIFGFWHISHRRKKPEQKVTATPHSFSEIRAIMQAQALHPKTFGKYRNAFAGKDVVLVCTGPSAKYYRPIPGAIHVGVNGAIYLDTPLDFVFLQDNTINQPGNETLTQDVLSYRPGVCQKFVAMLSSDLRLASYYQYNGGFKALLPVPANYFNREDISPYVLCGSGKIEDMPHDISIEPIGNLWGTAFSAMQFILFGAPRTIYLVGCDCSKGYAYKGKTNYLDLSLQIGSWKLMRFYASFYFPTQRIVSINPVGLKGLFADTYTDEYKHCLKGRIL